MTTWLYGLILPRNAGRVRGGMPGIGDAPVRLLGCGAVTAVVGTAAQPVQRSDLAAVRAHDRVLRAIAQQSVTIAAVRFGQTFASDTDACAELSGKSAAVTDTLEQLDGCVEMRVLLPHDASALPDDSSESVGPGRAYLESIRRSSPVPGVSLRGALGPLILQEHVEKLHVDGGAGVAFAHLVESGSVESYRQAIAALPALAEARVLGPLPLYTFSADDNG